MKKLKIFVIMSFDSEFEDLYSFIKEVIDKSDLDAEFELFRADDLLNQQNILKDIVVSIHESDLIIAELTGLNPNVFYELGLAHAFRKNVVLLTQAIDELPFDLRSYRVINYSTHFQRIKELEEKLIEILNKVIDGNISFGNPVTDWLGFEENNKIIEIEEDTDVKAVTEINEEILEKIEEKGFLDFLADMNDSMNKLTEIIEEFSEQTENMTKDIKEKSDQISKALESPSQGTASYVRKLARKSANILNEYGEFLSNYNKQYEKNWEIFEDSVLNLVKSPYIGANEDNLSGFNEFLDSMKDLQETMIKVRPNIDYMAISAASLKGIESSINRASALIERETNEFGGLLDKSISTLERVITVGQTKVERFTEDGNVN